ncbi:MAG: fused MFS/spermidine synthase [Deltaproteobacteria bacterium]|nr:fused MFS/spermidine synthase [Deltaproteobacteria bacterium]
MIYTLTSALSALLLFWMQPLVARLVLPFFGGTPQVWTTSLLFFQTILLLGYLLAHRLVRLPLRVQVAVQLSLIAAGGLFLPMRAPLTSAAAGDASVATVLVLLSSMVALPGLALSVHAPLLQRWFAHANPGRDPFRLYAASNIGSFAALGAFPFLLEPRLGIARQTWLWTGVYALLFASVASCGLLVMRSAPAALPVETAPRAAEAISWRRRLHWMALAAVPTSLLSGVTAHLATDVASIPLLWIVPLAIYLVTYIVAFADKPEEAGPRRLLLGAQVVLFALLVLVASAHSAQASIFIDLTAFAITALLCHRELSHLRPGPERLTDFYLAASIGSVIGGAFNGLLAPTLFTSVAEYPLALVAAAALRPVAARFLEHRRALVFELAVPLGLSAIAVIVLRTLGAETELLHAQLWKWLLFALALSSIFLASRRLAYALSFALTLAFGVWAMPEGTVLHRSRSFFGVHEVTEEHGFHWLYDGTTVHGAQNWTPARRREPQSYYVREGPVGQIFASLSARHAGKRVGVIGLGAGMVACHLRDDQELTVFEIDPSVAAIARDPQLFTCLSDCKPSTRIVLGDARLSLVREPEGAFDVILLDAFSSDAIPVHLLTREAIDVYLSRLAPGGLLVFHTSNRFLTLEPVIGAIARERGLVSRMEQYIPPAEVADDPERLAFSSRWVVAARTLADLGGLVDDVRWIPTTARRAWTDDHADVVSVMDFSH